MGWSNSGYRSDQGGWYKNAASGGGVATFTFKDKATDSANNTVRSYSIDIGTASADRLIVVAAMSQSVDPSSVIVDPSGANVTLTKDFDVNNTATGGGGFIGIYSGVVASGSGAKVIQISGVGVFAEVGVSLWVATGLNSNLKKHANGSFAVAASCTVDVTKDDFLVAMSMGNSGNSSFASSTETATAHSVDSVGPCATSADWLPIAASNASFSVASTSNSFAVVAVSYR